MADVAAPSSSAEVRPAAITSGPLPAASDAPRPAASAAPSRAALEGVAPEHEPEGAGRQGGCHRRAELEEPRARPLRHEGQGGEEPQREVQEEQEEDGGHARARAASIAA